MPITLKKGQLAEILAPDGVATLRDLGLPDCQTLAEDSYDRLRIVHAAYVGLPEACPSCGLALFECVKFGERNLWDNPDGSTLVAIHLYVPKLKCLVCSSVLPVIVPWIYPNSRMTGRLAKTILDILPKEESFAQIARDTGVNSARIQQLLCVACEELEKQQGHRLSETTGVDDFWIGKKPVFTIADTGPGGSLKTITEDRETATLRATLASFSNGEDVQNLTQDFCDEIRKAANEGDEDHEAPLPNATPAINHFQYGRYIVACFTAAQNQVFQKIVSDLKKADPKKREQFLFKVKSREQLAAEASRRAKNMAEPTRKMFRRLHFLLTKRRENLVKKGADSVAIVDFLLARYPLLAEAYDLKEFALHMRDEGKSPEQSLAELEFFKMQLGKVFRKRGGKAIVKCFMPFVNLIEKWKAAAFPTCQGTNNNLEAMHKGLRNFIRLGGGYSIPGLTRRARWRAAHKKISRWPKELAARPRMTLRQLDLLKNRKFR